MATSRAITPSRYQRSLQRYIDFKNGMSYQELAERDCVSEDTIQKSIREIEGKRMRESVEFVNEAVGGMVISLVGDLERTFRHGLAAKEEIYDNKAAKWTERPDIDTQIKAASEVRQLIGTIQKKDSKFVINNKNEARAGAGAVVNAGAVAAGMGFGSMEQTIRKIHGELEQQRLVGETPTVVAPPEEGEVDITSDDR